MNLKEFTQKIQQLQLTNELPFDIENLEITMQGDIYPRSLTNVEWDREFSCFKLVFENLG